LKGCYVSKFPVSHIVVNSGIITLH